MCGITGIVHLNSTKSYPFVLKKMADAIAHRGPDNEGFYCNDFVSFAHRRLSIIDLSEAGNQPYHSTDGRYSIVFNGEIYNYRTLKRELEHKHAFVSHGDTEVLLAAWAEWGKAAVERLEGMFAFVLWDNVEKRVYMVRDRLGIKPLYVTEQKGVTYFASEIRSLLASGAVERKLNVDFIGQYLRWQTVYQPNTLVKDVFLLAPGTITTLSDSGKTTETYWSLKDLSNKSFAGNLVEAKSEIKNLFLKAVEKRLVADVPFGAFLSGGIDSSAIVAGMSQFSSRVKTFHITFHEKKFDESAYAQLIADKYATNHEEIRLTGNDFLESLPRALAAMDHPSGDGPNSFLVSEVTKNAGVTMALSGLGGDELFAGYSNFKHMLQLSRYSKVGAIPYSLRNALGKAIQPFSNSVKVEKMLQFFGEKNMDLHAAHGLLRQALSRDKISALGFESLSATAYGGILHPELHKIISQTSVLEMSTYMVDVLLRDTDQMSMAHALEVRVPLLDHALVELALSLPDAMKLTNSPKQLFVDALEGLVPDEIVNRPKMGFTFPWEVWMKNELRPLCEDSLAYLEHLHLFKKGAIQRLWQEFLNGSQTVTWTRIWPLIVLGVWMQTNKIEA